ncbi:unnamed protein product [Polarella glacialis]|uniref:Glutathione transferase n=1 Tax=Polarella glacialis TaxID=89957 RepID=A0A813FT82_POLGL|nr:unnamed protein product [Polarella glacialis]
MAPTFTYFKGRGVGEIFRLVAAVGKFEYVEDSYPFIIEMKDGAPDFSTFKREGFVKDQADGKLKASMGKVPFLTLDGGAIICQSKAIERYAAKTTGLMGADDVEAAQIEGMNECVRDIKDAWGKDKDEAVLKTNIEKLEAAIPGSTGCAVGSKMSYADVVLYHMLAAPKGALPEDKRPAVMEACPKLKAICEAVAANAELTAYLAGRADTAI